MDSIEEFRWLPEDPSQMTWRGRYTHVHKFLAKSLKLTRGKKNDALSILDIGCGIAPFGSPTLHDMWDFLKEYSLKPFIMGIDSTFPPDLVPRCPIVYRHKMEMGKIRRMFDIVCILHLVEHAPYETYHFLRTRALRRLRNGGIFIATQQLGRWKMDPAGPDIRRLPNIIKVMQKRVNGLVVVGLLPDPVVPWPRWFLSTDREANLREYAHYRTRVLMGAEELPRNELDEDGFRTTLSWLTLYPAEILQYEALESMIKEGNLTRVMRKQFDSKEVARTARNAATWFRSPDKR